MKLLTTNRNLTYTIAFIVLILFVFLPKNIFIKTFKILQIKDTVASIQKKLENKRKDDFKNIFGNINDIKKIKIIGLKNNWTKK